MTPNPDISLGALLDANSHYPRMSQWHVQEVVFVVVVDDRVDCCSSQHSS
jgi:hypothetical protein